MLRLDFAYVRLNDPVAGLIEMLRHDSLQLIEAEPRVIGQTLKDSLGANPRKSPRRARNPFGDGSLSINLFRILASPYGGKSQDADQVIDTALQAFDLVGGLIHRPSSGRPLGDQLPGDSGTSKW